jgi:hypothetical protein
MESLRVLPIMMFLSGALLIYCGIKGVYPIDVIRGNISGFENDPTNVGYDSTSNPFYAGTPLYRRPSGTTPGLF